MSSMGPVGIVPGTFADQGIKFRIPYSMASEQLVQANQSGVFFPEAVFLHNVDKPFEIWQMIVRLSAVDEEGNLIYPQPAAADLEKRIRLTVQDTSKNESLTKSVNLVDTLINSQEGDAGVWGWNIPYTLVRSEGFMVGIDSQAFPLVVVPNPADANTNVFVQVDRVRVEVSFQGFLEVIQPASDSR